MSESTSALSSFTFPRTGKRGVPQQFPRRLFEMLEGETKLCETSATHKKVIAWSCSGQAFRIYDSAEFATVVLPKYFRTKKFSSFQRNLNLYGFSKIRRGPDVDMYAHPSFVRNTPGTLLQLRKTTTSMRKQLLPTAEAKMKMDSHRTVSPLSSPHHSDSEQSPVEKITKKIIVPQVGQWGNTSLRYSSIIPTLAAPRADRGKLDLLALALEQAAN